MKVAKEAVGYYCAVTGNEWSDFFSKLDGALADPTPTGENWLIKKLMGVIVDNGMTVSEFRANKDAIKKEFDDEGRKNAGEFFTPIIWAEEGHKLMGKYIPNWREWNLWECSCYTLDTQIYVKGVTNSFNRGKWCSYMELKDTDKVLGFNPKTGKPSWVGFHSRFGKPYTGLMYRFVAKDGVGGTSFVDKISAQVCVTADHVMPVYEDGKFVKYTAEQLFKKLGESFYRTKTSEYHSYELASYERDIHGNGMAGATVVRIPLTYADCEVVPVVDYPVWDITMDSLHIFLTRRGTDSPVFSSNCGSGNLVRTANMAEGRLFMSTLQQDDVDMLKTMPEFAGATIFQCDFLEGLDYDVYNTDFLNKLPQRLQDIIRNDEPLIVYANPPYKVGSAKATDVGNYMSGIGLSKAACDIYYQFVWRVMHFVEMFNLKNLYFCHFGPLAFFTGSGSGKLLAEYEHCFEFVDGMCLAAQEFSDTSSSISWGIGCTLWKSRGGYMAEQDHKDILLEKKFKLPDGSIGCEGRVLYAPPRMKLSEWVQPKDVMFYEQVPLMTSHLTFKGGELNGKIAPYGAKMASNALGTLMNNNTFTRVEQQSAVLSMPSTIQHCDITEENFWRCVASYTFRRLFNASWAVAKKEISAPDVRVEGYTEWVANSLVIFLFDWNSMMSAVRNVEYGGSLYQVRNRLFYCSEDDILANCTDEKILEDLKFNPAENEFMLKQIEIAEKYWKPEIKELFDFCRGYTLATLNLRHTVGYVGSLDCWDAGFQQIRSSLWSDEMEEKLKALLAKAKDVLRMNLESFGFISEVEGE